MIGDQLTCKNMRGAKRWRVSEPTRRESLAWVREGPGKEFIKKVIINQYYKVVLYLHDR